VRYDVIVVGAGPAGSTTAKFLSAKGIEVLVVDKERFPRDKPCGGGLPLRVLKRFRYIEESNLVDSYSYGGYAYSSSLKYKAKIEKDDPIVGMVLRKKFDTGLIKIAIDSGAKFLEGKRVIEVKKDESKATIFLEDHSKIDCDLVVGADGVWSTVAKRTGLVSSKRNVDMCIFKEEKVGEKILDDFFTEKRMCYIHSKFQGIPGYGWVFPKKEYMNIGIAVIGASERFNLLSIFKKYIELLKETKVIPKDTRVEGCKGGALHTLPLEKTYSDRVILVGDAGGFTNPLSGEGIFYAMSSGEICARIVEKALEEEDTSQEFLSTYQREWKKDFGKELRIFSRAIKRWRKADNEKFVELASKDKKLAEMTIGILHGGLSIQKYRWKLIKRYLHVYLKDILGMM
jgi:geranylgeranyl reductase family protein